MDISEKDQKILWGRAAGRCSFADCRKVLTHDAADGDPKTLGQMAHIVAESPDGPRGASVLSAAERAGYANRILVCPNHHTLIDQDPTGYPVERLHAVKSAHELWVAETLTAQTVDSAELVYADLVDTITEGLRLESWASFIETAIHDRINDASIEAQGILAHRMIATIWPGTHPILERAIKRLVQAFSDFLSHYLDGSEPLGETWHGPDHSYRNAGLGIDRYQELRDEEEHWSRVNYALLERLTIRINQFADAVRGTLNPMYFRVHGRFVIVDSLGTWHDGVGTFSLPNEESVELRLVELGWHPDEDAQNIADSPD